MAHGSAEGVLRVVQQQQMLEGGACGLDVNGVVDEGAT